MIVKSHADQALLSNFVITPMAFLGGTFFPVERMPEWAQYILKFLPLTHASEAMRVSAYGNVPDASSYIILIILGVLCFILSCNLVKKARD